MVKKREKKGSDKPIEIVGAGKKRVVDTLVCLVTTDPPPCPSQLTCVKEVWDQLLESGDFKGRSGQHLLIYTPAGGLSCGSSGYSAGGCAGGDLPRYRRILLVGLGDDLSDIESWRKAGGTTVSALLKTRVREAEVVWQPQSAIDDDQAAAALGEGLTLGSYRFRKYRKPREDSVDDDLKDEQPPPSLRRIVVSGSWEKGGSRSMTLAVSRAVGVATAVNSARDMANEPGNGWTPAHFAHHAEAVAHEHGLALTVLDGKAMEKLGMGGIVAVNRGSSLPPSLIILEYRAKGGSRRGKRGKGSANPTLLLVGKGLTFDSGGISLKPSAGMEEMKYDMCGGAAVLAAMEVIGRERPKGVDVVAMIPATENLPGPAALKPGDIIRQYGGASVEVINTDAEGRLVLADALAYGVEKFRPAAVVDLATLTGAVIVALGHHYAGMLGNDDELCAKVLEAGERAGEPLWRLPLGPEYRKQLKSKVADLKNVDKRDAGTIIGAAFLREFVGDTPWVHLDIAGTAWNFTEKSYLAKGPSGFGVRTLVELLRHWS